MYLLKLLVSYKPFQQEPGSKEEILNGLQFVRPGKGFRPNFQLTEKLNVNGDHAAPIYDYLKKSCPVAPQATFSEKNRLNYEVFHASDIRWNFEKFLIGKDGKAIKRYWHGVEPHQLYEDIERAIRLKL
ncbi:glutathione peroxidase-like [Tropilaelaps mercedesae]|uniref:glutathione peroxidase n=1 Tax=Tropilaelaps mercedesae TaxID=418985 RepID=A0A1V9XFM5_9ACAR|nr:glutathione peroxidase-like [Tropilaelaps mercedesae]